MKDQPLNEPCDFWIAYIECTMITVSYISPNLCTCFIGGENTSPKNPKRAVLRIEYGVPPSKIVGKEKQPLASKHTMQWNIQQLYHPVINHVCTEDTTFPSHVWLPEDIFRFLLTANFLGLHNLHIPMFLLQFSLFFGSSRNPPQFCWGNPPILLPKSLLIIKQDD